MASKGKKSSRSRRPERMSVFFGLGYRHRAADGKVHLRMRWGWIFGLMAGFTLAGYLSLGALVYFYTNNFVGTDDDLPPEREQEPLGDFTITYGEALVLPVAYLLKTESWGDFRSRFGEWQLDKGQRLLQAERIREGLIFVQAGATRAPHRLDGRRMMAELRVSQYNQPDRAIEELNTGLEYLGTGDPDEELEYVKYYIRFLLKLRRDEELTEFTQKMLAEGTGSERMRKALAWAAARAFHLKGQYDKAEDFILDYDLEGTIDGMLLSSRISWDRGAKEASVAKLEEALDRLGSHPTIHAELTRRYVALEQVERARRHAVERSIAEPDEVTARIELLYVFNRSGTPRDLERAEKEIREILNHPKFRDNEVALIQLAQFAATSENIDLAKRLYERAIEQDDFDIGNFALQLIEAHIAAGDFEGAIEFCEQVVEDNATWFDDKKPIFNSLRSIALYGMGNQLESDQWLQAFMDGSEDRRQYLPVAQRFEKLGGFRQARRILRRAHQGDPENQRVLEALVRVELKSGVSDNIGQYLENLIRLRRPPVDLLAEAYQKLASDRYIFVDKRATLLIRLEEELKERGQLPRGALPSGDPVTMLDDRS